MNREKVKKVLLIILHLFLQVIFSKIKFFSIIPIGLAFAFSRLFFGANIFAVTGFYLISKLFLFSEVNWILITAYEIVFLALYYFANEFVKQDKKMFVAILFVVLSNVLYLYFCLSQVRLIVECLISLVLQISAFIYFYKFNKVYKNKLVFYKFSRNDYFIFSIMMLLLSLGVFSFDLIHSKLGLFVIILFVILGAKILPIDRFFISVIVVAIGSVVSTGDFLLFNFTVIFSVLISLIKDFNKYFYIALAVIISTILAIIFEIKDIFSLFSLIFAFFIYIFIPNKIIKKISDSLEADAMTIIFRKYQEGQINEVRNKLILMSGTLKEMQTNFKFLLVGKIDREKACLELAGDVISKCCSECENYRYCFMQNIDKRKMFESMLSRAIENKQISSGDLSNGIQAYCNKSGIVASEINQMARLFLSYESAMKTQDESKLLISSEIGNFAEIFKNFAKNIKNSLKINEKLSKLLKETFVNNLVDSKEVVIFENEFGIEMINVVALNEQILRRELVDSISKTIKNQVQLKNVVHLEKSGFSLATFVPKAKVKVQFAISTKAKEQKNGDTGAVVKISENKYFVAIADGMGHGEQANRMSSMVLKLIKSMFEVGLDDELIIESVNKLLIPAGLDNFTTLDVCVVDIEKHECSFIKMGSSVSVLKHKDTSEAIVSESLPIGIVQNIKPTIVKKPIFQGDMIFLASDGVVDSFPNIESYKTFINDAKIYNVQKFLDDVVFDASSMNQTHVDDMTIIGINLLKN